MLVMVWLCGQTGLAQAALTIEITQGTERAVPIAVVPFGWTGAGARPPEDIAAIVAADLARSGRFAPVPQQDLVAQPHEGTQVRFADWRLLGTPSLVVGKMQPEGNGYRVQFQLFDIYGEKQLRGFSFKVGAQDLRRLAHQIADIIYEALLNERGAFAARIAYVTSAMDARRKRLYSLYVADSDGYNPRVIVQSRQPLMSPAWSYDGRKLAYVSFEARRSMIFVQDLTTGRRERVASYPGNNSAPAWSPDGTRLAMSLSRDGNPEIYILHLASGELKRLTSQYGIDTEPVWSPDGKTIYFVSDRGGRPQIYRMPAQGGAAERVSFEGSYNASPRLSPDGKRLAMVRGEGNTFRIAVLDLETRQSTLLTEGRLDESPSFAPNGNMIIYATEARGRGVLAAVSIDGRVRQRLGLQEGGDAREPVWGPLPALGK